MYTFAPDGSDFNGLGIEGTGTPYWSPDGSQIAYGQSFPFGPPGLQIADADGSNVQMLVRSGEAGPWHPGDSATLVTTPVPVETPTPVVSPTPAPAPVAIDEAFAERSVLRFEFDPGRGPGQLVAVDPATGESRVVLSDLADLLRARWSADHRWVALENGTGLWVMRPGEEPRRIADPVTLWAWSPNGARLMSDGILGDEHLGVFDAV